MLKLLVNYCKHKQGTFKVLMIKWITKYISKYISKKINQQHLGKLCGTRAHYIFI